MLDRMDPDEVAATRGRALARVMTPGHGLEVGPDGYVLLSALRTVLRGFDLHEARETAERSGGRLELREIEEGVWAMRAARP